MQAIATKSKPWMWVTAIALVVFIAFYFGVFRLSLGMPNFVERDGKIAPSQPARTLKITPVFRDEVVITDAQVGVKGDQRAKVLGVTINTNTAKFSAVYHNHFSIKDPPTLEHDVNCDCYPATIQGSQVIITTVLDKDATKESLRQSQGILEKWRQFLCLWCDVLTGQILAVQQYATALVGNTCASSSWNTVQEAIRRSYRARASSMGIDPNKVQIKFGNPPAFDQVPPPPKKVDSFKMKYSPATCEEAPGALQPVEDGPSTPPPARPPT